MIEKIFKRFSSLFPESVTSVREIFIDAEERDYEIHFIRYKTRQKMLQCNEC